MTNPCLFCHKPVTDDIKRLPMTDGSGRVTEKLVHRACHERLLAALKARIEKEKEA